MKYKSYLLCLSLLAVAWQSPVYAQAMTEAAYRKLSAVHELLGDNRTQDALVKLQAMETMRLSEYEKALVYQTYGFAYAELNQLDNAVTYFERCLAVDALGKEAQHGMLYSLASLYASQSRYQQAIDTLNRWFPAEPNPPGQANMLMASSLYELKQFQQALPYAKKAIAGTSQPAESWYQLVLSIYFETNDYQSAVALLRQMLGRWPDTLSYWEMLAGAYQQLGQDTQAMAATDLAYKKGLLTDSDKLVNLARMKLYVGVPDEAGRLLTKELAAGRVTNTEVHQTLLLNAWIEAKAFDQAMQVADTLTAMTNNGQYAFQKSQILTEQAQWQGALTASREAIQLGGFKQMANAYLIQGMAQTELNQLEAAVMSFEKAQQLGGSAGAQAEGWLAFVKDKQALQAELATKASPTS